MVLEGGFEKVSFEQFKKDLINMIGNSGISNIVDSYDLEVM